MTKEQEFRKQAEEAKFEAFSFMCKKVAELEKENAELKERLKEHESIGNAQFWENVWSWKSKSEQLTKAKELLKRCYDNYIHLEPLRSEIEQFLKIMLDKLH